MKVIKLFRKWAGYNEDDLVIASNTQADYLINQAYGELVVKCPSFNNRFSGKGKHKLLPLTNEKINRICRNLDADILKAKRMKQKLKKIKRDIDVKIA